MVARISIRYGVLLICALLAGGAERDAIGAERLIEFTGSLAANEELATINTRAGVTNRVLITKPTGAPKGIFLLYPGGEGFLVKRNGKLRGVRRRLFARRGYIAAVVDVPSDQPRGLKGEFGKLERFRIKAEHTQDARAVIDALHARWQLPVYLLGISMGAISVAHIAATLDDPRLSGVILLSSPSERGRHASWVSVPDARLDKITVPVLLVHNSDDECPGSTFETALTYPPMFTASPRVGFIEVNGGKTPLSDNPCRGKTYHTYYGKRGQMVEAVIQWLNGKDIRSVK